MYTITLMLKNIEYQHILLLLKVKIHCEDFSPKEGLQTVKQTDLWTVLERSWFQFPSSQTTTGSNICLIFSGAQGTYELQEKKTLHEGVI